MITNDMMLQLEKLAIAERPALYMRALDRLDRDLMCDQFWDDAYLEYGVYSGAIGGFVDYCLENLGTHKHNHHFIGQNLIEVEGDIAFGETYFQSYHKVVMPEGGESDMFIAGRYIDRYEKRGGVWKFSYRAEVVDWARFDPSTDSRLLGPESLWLRGARKPDDRLYKRSDMCWPAKA